MRGVSGNEGGRRVRRLAGRRVRDAVIRLSQPCAIDRLAGRRDGTIEASQTQAREDIDDTKPCDRRDARRRVHRRRAATAAAEDVVVKLWSRADRSGPLRAGNIVAAAEQLNRMLAATGTDKRVKIDLIETNAKGYDDDALDLLKAFAVDKGPDIFVLAHEWIGAFAEAGYAQNLEEHIKSNPELYGDIIPPLWEVGRSTRARATASRRIPKCACTSSTTTSCARWA